MSRTCVNPSSRSFSATNGAFAILAEMMTVVEEADMRAQPLARHSDQFNFPSTTIVRNQCLGIYFDLSALSSEFPACKVLSGPDVVSRSLLSAALQLLFDLCSPTNPNFVQELPLLQLLLLCSPAFPQWLPVTYNTAKLFLQRSRLASECLWGSDTDLNMQTLPTMLQYTHV